MEPLAARRPRIAFLLGKPVKGGSLFPELFKLLRAAGVDVAVHLPHTSPDPVPTFLFSADLVVNRGLGLAALKAAQRLEDAGVRCCNRIRATLSVRDRALVVRRLVSAGVPVPATVEAATWSGLRAAAAGRPVVVKSMDGGLGRGAGVLAAERDGLPEDAPFAGPYLMQARIQTDGRDRKLYVVGNQVSGLLKPWPRRTPDAEPFSPDPVLVDVARRAAAALELEVCGIDMVVGADGPTVVDVNPFPGFKGIPEAARIISDRRPPSITVSALVGSRYPKSRRRGWSRREATAFTIASLRSGRPQTCRSGRREAGISLTVVTLRSFVTFL